MSCERNLKETHYTLETFRYVNMFGTRETVKTRNKKLYSSQKEICKEPRLTESTLLFNSGLKCS